MVLMYHARHHVCKTVYPAVYHVQVVPGSPERRSGTYSSLLASMVVFHLFIYLFIYSLSFMMQEDLHQRSEGNLCLC